MARYLIIKDGRVANIVEYGATDPNAPPPAPEEKYVLDAAPGTVQVGQSFNVAPSEKSRFVNALDPIILNELLRISNQIAILRLMNQMTIDEYKTFLMA